MNKIIIVAPNVSEQMGGEAIKALQIYQEFAKLAPDTALVTHERNREELEGRLGQGGVHFVPDTWVAVFLWRSVLFRWLLNWWFSAKAVALSEEVVDARGWNPRDVVILQVEPNSPVVPRAVSRRCKNGFGPINGNIYYPAIFHRRERLGPKLRRTLHFPVQYFNRLFFAGITRADFVFCAGGDRTRRSLRAVGCEESQLVDTLDCGIQDALFERGRVHHEGSNPRFVHFGRLVFHKCTYLIVQALAYTKQPIVLDVVGRGPELEVCRDLAARLGVQDRVNFLGWYPSHAELFDSFDRYRGFVLPSIEDANGIVVQEGMALGLPAICLDWGGPQLLVEHERTGYLIAPVSEEHIAREIAKHMDYLAENPAAAEAMSKRAREVAEEWRWSRVASRWVELVQRA